MPMLKMDDAHHFSSHKNRHPERYSITASPGIVLDATGYTFKPNSPMPQGKTAERIEILRQKAITERTTGKKRYLVQWTPGKTRYELSGITLQPGPESPPFDGFKAGERWFVFVSTPYETNKSFVLWSGVVEVR